MRNILSVDVEDWFHILDLPTAPDLHAWHQLESRVEKNLHTILDLLERQGTKATLFVLGWVAEQYPNLVREAHRRGHEIASHGYAHQLVYSMTTAAFREDVIRSKRILEDLIGGPVLGFRAPGFSITPATPWAFGVLAEAGHTYDSSVFPARRAHGGFLGAALGPHRIDTDHGPIVEFPISVTPLLGTRICFSGGGYFRLFPWAFIAASSRRANAENRPVVYYLHPREIDPDQPRLPMNALRRFKSYVNLGSTQGKLLRLTQTQPLTSFRDWLRQTPLPACHQPSGETR